MRHRSMRQSGGDRISFIRRGQYIGQRRGSAPSNEVDHFYQCTECGGWVDMRDLGSVFDHEPGGSHPASDKPQ